ncbi:ubiquitin carboxyl-terminal hydrolase-like protein [Rostrohypoxylon terebratum]|nr:ubiquitin carboxyl-terminal hydrolase-like protein [Rostrohypoxylon terebratum]
MTSPTPPHRAATSGDVMPDRDHLQPPVERITDQLEVPLLDDRTYRVIRLPNQLEALLVHDPDTDKASAALDVNVGNFSDEDDMPGMAHAVEHLLFMGTKKYPAENAYNVYLSSHSGSSNAYTGATSTNYFFDIAAKPSNGEEPSETNLSPLYGGLDRFAQFFIEPLFLSSTLDRELRAVDSENKKNLQSDQWRLHQLEKSLSNPRHPYCHFSTGNFEVLKTEPEAKGIDVRQKFIDFHEKHYSANRMKLCVLGREPLDVLEKWVAELFSGVPNKDLPQNRWEDEVPYAQEHLARQCFAKPVMDSRELNLYFPFLDEEFLYEGQPSRYISHLIGHEGPGSIMAYLKSRGWANSLSAGAYSICPGTPDIFDCQIRLTKEGLKHYKEVVKAFFQYVSLLRQTPPQQWIFDEQKGMSDVDFKFKQKTPASRFTSYTCAMMQRPSPPEWLLSLHRFRKFDPASIVKAIQLLRPDNFRMTIVSRDFPGDWDQKEKWYGTEYKSEKIPEEFLAELFKALNCTAEERLPALHLPHKNQFIPTKLEVEKKEVKQPATAPRVIRNDEVARTWYKKDDTFWVPKANLIVSIKNPSIFASAENSVKSKLFTDLVRDALEEYSYDAELAGLQYNVSLDSRGLFIEVSGYNDKLPVLLEQVLITMRDLEVKDERFEIIKERLTRGYKNCELQQPFTQIGDYVSWLTSEHDYVVEQLVAELPGITADAVRQFHKQIMSQMHIEAYVHGNVYKEDALKLTDMIEKILKPRVLAKEEWPIIRSLDFPPGSNFLFQKVLRDPANVNHCIEYYLHIGDKGDRLVRAKTQLLDQIIHEPAFDQLRTKEQLGYVVFSGLRSSATTYGFRFIIQSERTSEYLESRIDSFLATQTTSLENMSDADFESHKRSVIIKRLEKLKNLDQETGRHWAQVNNEYYDFEAAQRDAAQVKQLTKAEMVEFYSTYIKPTSPTRAKLVVQLVAQGIGPKVKEAEESSNGDTATIWSNGTEPFLIKNVRDYKARLSSCKTQLAVKTSSSKKRKISTRQSATTEDSLGSISSPDTPLQSCEQLEDADPTFSFSLSSEIPNTASYRADSIPPAFFPASSLPPRLQTSTSNWNNYSEYASSAASSPSGAYADLTIHSDRGADTPGPDLSSAASSLYPPCRASSPFAKSTLHRGVMGGAADFPERASSPLKRRASSMEPDVVDQDAAEDVDMITAPTSDTLDTSKSQEPANGTETGTPLPTDGQETTKVEEGPTSMDISPSPARQPPASIEAHVKAIRAFVEEQDSNPLTEDQQCFLVSKEWLKNVPDDMSSKHKVEDWSLIPPVDNSDIILEVIDDPCVGNGVDILKRKFVRLKKGYDTEQFKAFPPSAWELLAEWPGLKEGQIPILRTAHATGESGSNIMFEWHPPVLSIYRLWSAISELPIDAAMKSKNPPPGILVRSRSTKFQAFLKQAKRVVKVDLDQRVRAWMVRQPPTEQNADSAKPSPPTSGDNAEPTLSEPWRHLLLDVESFLALEKGSDRELIDFSDLTNSNQKQTSKTLSYFGITQDQAIILDPHESGTNWTSTVVSQNRTSVASLPSRNSTSVLAVQNRNVRSGRTSPLGVLTRGRSAKSGRVAGCVGLANLGNTCYMNAALQCVRAVEELTKYFLSGEWEKELNKDNVLSHNGEVAASYAYLLKEIYKDSPPGYVSPRQFKNTIGRYAVGFSGYGQQDSQEFLGFLLDGLQEDLSRVKKKPYIEKPDSTDDMINNPDAIRQMAETVWDITKKRDDSVIADLFTGLYKSTLVCPECQKVSITFDPFNNLTLPLPLENKWSHAVKFFPLNGRPIFIRVELDKHASIKSLKEFLSTKTGVPPERMFGAEEWKNKFYKLYADLASASDEIASNDTVNFYELEAKPTNYGTKPQKQQKFGEAVRSMVDEEEHNASAAWDDAQAARLLVPVFHRRPAVLKHSFQSHRWKYVCAPHFIVVTPEEARSEDAIYRKVLEKVATLSKHARFQRAEESDSSDGTDPDIVRVGDSDAGSSNESRVVAQSVKGEDDMVDIQMNDVNDTKVDPSPTEQFCFKRPSWVDPGKFLPPDLQNLFEMCIYSETGSWLPTGNNGLGEDKDLPKLSLRIPPESPSSEDQFDHETNGTASNEESSSDETPQQSTGQCNTRMVEESDDDDDNLVTKSQLIKNQPAPHRIKPNKQTRAKGKQTYSHKQSRMNKKGSKKKQKQRQQQPKEKYQNLVVEDSFGANEIGPDGGPLIRLKEAIVVNWTDSAYATFFEGNSFSSDNSLEAWEGCETLPDPELDRAQAARSKRKKNGISLEACLDEFEREEILSEQDMWFCPRCKEHRRASKKFDLWKTPDILIIHLKRFSSSGFRRDKLELLVEFPVENLDITSRVLQKEDGKQEVYDLIGVDCHWGGLGGGHYTAFAKNFVDNQWYTYNDSTVSSTSADRIVDSSAYLLFYRRRSEVPLGGPRFQQILDRFEDDASDSDLPDSGEGQGLDEGFSPLTGSSSALKGAGATPPHDNAKNTNGDWVHGESRTIDNVIDPKLRGVQPSVEEDEAIDLTQDIPAPTGYRPFGSNWNFSGIAGNEDPGQSGDSDAASDEAQHNWSGDDEGVVSPRPDTDTDLGYPGMGCYELPPQPEVDTLPYNEPPPPEYSEMMTRDEIVQIWDQKQTVHSVPPEGEAEQRSEAAAEIHLDEDDKIKLS